MLDGIFPIPLSSLLLIQFHFCGIFCWVLHVSCERRHKTKSIQILFHKCINQASQIFYIKNGYNLHFQKKSVFRLVTEIVCSSQKILWYLIFSNIYQIFSRSTFIFRDDTMNDMVLLCIHSFHLALKSSHDIRRWLLDTFFLEVRPLYSPLKSCCRSSYALEKHTMGKTLVYRTFLELN